MAKVVVVNGPNINLIGKRETDIYGETSIDDIDARLREKAKKKGIEIEIFQSNHEGEIVDFIQSADADIIIINPGAFTHYSLAIRDALAAVRAQVIEVHLSNIYSREDFRKESVTAPVATGQISGFGQNSYYMAMEEAIRICTEKDKKH